MKVFVCERAQVTHALCQVLVEILEYYCQFFFQSSLYASFFAKATFPLTLSYVHLAPSESKLLLRKTKLVHTNVLTCLIFSETGMDRSFHRVVSSHIHSFAKLVVLYDIVAASCSSTIITSITIHVIVLIHTCIELYYYSALEHFCGFLRKINYYYYIIVLKHSPKHRRAHLWLRVHLQLVRHAPVAEPHDITRSQTHGRVLHATVVDVCPLARVEVLQHEALVLVAVFNDGVLELSSGGLQETGSQLQMALHSQCCTVTSRCTLLLYFNIRIVCFVLVTI